MNKDLEKVYKRNIYELQKQNKTLMIRVKELTEENYKLKTDKEFVGWVENPDALHFKKGEN
tara:strand:+ start:199 stop:381 length:183 start_codon:yes stop_codon:yes gene_type:complete